MNKILSIAFIALALTFGACQTTYAVDQGGNGNSKQLVLYTQRCGYLCFNRRVNLCKVDAAGNLSCTDMRASFQDWPGLNLW